MAYGQIEKEESFRADLIKLINCHSRENVSDTPDAVLADFLISCLDAYDNAVLFRNELISCP